MPKGVAGHTDDQRAGRVAGSPELRPYQQGEFDGLCGIYAAVNGLRLLLQARRPLSYAQCAELYEAGVNRLERAGGLPNGATWGISEGRWRRIAAALCVTASRLSELAVSSTRPFPLRQHQDRAAVFAAIEAAIDAQRPVLLTLDGTYNHYTVICGYTPARFILHDSYGYRWINRASCGVTRDEGAWRHRIATSSIMALQLLS